MLLSDLASSLHLLFTGKDCEITSLGMLKDASNSQVAYCESEKFIECLNKSHKPVWIRQVIVPGIMDNETYLQELAIYLKKIKNTINILQ